MRIKFLVVSVFLFPVLAGAQQAAQPAPQRDASAIAVIQQALNVLGGRAASVVTDSTVTGQVEPVGQSTLIQGTFTWKYAGPEFRCEVPTANGTQVLVSGHGSPTVTGAKGTKSLSLALAQAITPLHLPAVVLLGELNDPNYTISFLDTETVNGAAAVRIRTSLDTDPVAALVTPQEWLFDAATGLPVVVRYRLPSNSNPSVFEVEEVHFSNFQSVSGVVVPYQIQTYIGGTEMAVFKLSSVTFNRGLPPSTFDSPNGGGQ